MAHRFNALQTAEVSSTVTGITYLDLTVICDCGWYAAAESGEEAAKLYADHMREVREVEDPNVLF